MIAQKNEQVERELEKLVSIIQEVIPSVNEIRVFGSYNNGNWNPEKSDVDVFVETADEDYSRMRFFFNFFPIIPYESNKRKGIRKEIFQKLGANPNRLSMNFFSSSDVQIFRENYRSNMICVIESMKSGRLLYQNKQIPMTN
ncbi:MAG TPA: nucleotidyltransferase domain-containing protein [Candidatus Nanoarchaeia archaeon]|nr:nucleotidyltransferase domain-containing protein [Candidatus Nanoarchaeia archaeon]